MLSPEPLPPLHLAERVGSLEGQPDPLAAFDAYGAKLLEDVVALLPDGRVAEGSTVLDFGCGAGRLTRHLLHAPGVAAVHACDIDERSVQWLSEALSRVQAFRSHEEPPLDRPDETFDLVIAVSVFSHLGESWSRWMAELHRVTAPGGLLVATFMGEGMRDRLLAPGDPIGGMLVLHPDQDWDAGGPMVLHETAWLREHWSAWFTPVTVTPSGLGAEPGEGQGVYVGRRVTRAETRRGRLLGRVLRRRPSRGGD